MLCLRMHHHLLLLLLLRLLRLLVLPHHLQASPSVAGTSTSTGYRELPRHRHQRGRESRVSKLSKR